MTRRLVTTILLVLAVGASGCMLPEYYTPGGYSSTYRKRMSESTIDWPEPERSSVVEMPWQQCQPD